MQISRLVGLIPLMLSGYLFSGTSGAETAKTWRFEQDGLVISVVGKDAEFDDSRSYQVVVSDELRIITRLEVNRDGIVTGAWLTDMDDDGAFELVVATGQLDGTNDGAIDIHEWTDFNFASTKAPQLAASQAVGYRGYDQFKVTKGRLERSYPVFAKGTGEPVPNGSMAYFEYRYAEKLWERVNH